MAADPNSPPELEAVVVVAVVAAVAADPNRPPGGATEAAGDPPNSDPAANTTIQAGIHTQQSPELNIHTFLIRC